MGATAGLWRLAVSLAVAALLSVAARRARIIPASSMAGEHPLTAAH